MSKITVWLHNHARNPFTLRTGLEENNGEVHLEKGEKKKVDIHKDQADRIRKLGISVEETTSERTPEEKKQEDAGRQADNNLPQSSPQPPLRGPSEEPLHPQRDLAEHERAENVDNDSIKKLLADAEAGTVAFPQLRSRAKELLGNDFPLGNSPKKDDIVELLMARQKRDDAASKRST